MKKSLKFCKKSKGFTLVELVIVIAIVIILSVISVPIYRGYIDKSKMAEGYALLGTVLSAQKAYYAEYGNFYRDPRPANTGRNDTNYSNYEPVLGIDARGNKFFSSIFLGWGGNSPDIKLGFFAVVFMPEGLVAGKSRLALRYDVNEASNLGIYVYD